MNYGSLSTEQTNSMSAGLDMLSPSEFVTLMNTIDLDAVAAVKNALPAIAKAIEEISARMKRGGRLIYMGAGTSGRLGVLDASECPPTFGVSHDLVVGIIAGGDRALRNAVEGAEDVAELAVEDLKKLDITDKDSVVSISASGTARYCFGALDYARSKGALALAMVCNTNAPLIDDADIAIILPTGAEILSGSTRLKAGTATKLALNMLSTGVMIRLGKVYKNLMVDMTPTNIKLKDRAHRIIRKALDCTAEEAASLFERSGGRVKTAIVMGEAGCGPEEADRALAESDGFVRGAAALLKK